jgi:hypothetical protein
MAEIPPTPAPRGEDALEACAREVYANVTFNAPSKRDVAEVVAIMRRHGLRGPEACRKTAIDGPHYVRCALPHRHEGICRARTPEESHEH